MQRGLEDLDANGIAGAKPLERLEGSVAPKKVFGTDNGQRTFLLRIGGLWNASEESFETFSKKLERDYLISNEII